VRKRHLPAAARRRRRTPRFGGLHASTRRALAHLRLLALIQPPPIGLLSQGYLYTLHVPQPGGPGVVISNSDAPLPSPLSARVRLPGREEWLLQVAPACGWAPAWRGGLLAAGVIISVALGLLLLGLMVNNQQQAWLLRDLKVGWVSLGLEGAAHIPSRGCASGAAPAAPGMARSAPCLQSCRGARAAVSSAGAQALRRPPLPRCFGSAEPGCSHFEREPRAACPPAPPAPQASNSALETEKGRASALLQRQMNLIHLLMTNQAGDRGTGWGAPGPRRGAPPRPSPGGSAHEETHGAAIGQRRAPGCSHPCLLAVLRARPCPPAPRPACWPIGPPPAPPSRRPAPVPAERIEDMRRAVGTLVGPAASNDEQLQLLELLGEGAGAGLGSFRGGEGAAWPGAALGAAEGRLHNRVQPSRKGANKQATAGQV
jgi:hypothetical protein